VGSRTTGGCWRRSRRAQQAAGPLSSRYVERVSKADGDPVLWHIPVSHYNEKVRWALDLKGVDAVRRTPPPGAHIAVAIWLTKGSGMTFPLLQLDGRAIGDSTEIIAALEARYPDPPLYPDDPAELDRALELEDFFDEELGPHSRLLAFHELGRSEPSLRQFTADILPASLAGNDRVVAVATKGTAAFARARYRVASEASADLARAKILAAFDRLEAELHAGPGDYLVGDRFTVADLTAASLFAPVVGPPEGPASPGRPPSYEDFCRPLRERPGFEWVEQTFSRHRQDAVRP
jgi:glutathione S-transferase